MVDSLHNTFVNLLLANSFLRTSRPLSEPIVVNAAPGAGKSTLLLEFLPTFGVAICTHGEPTPFDIANRRIQPFRDFRCASFNILDEYHCGDSSGPFQALVGDPQQSSEGGKEAHFVKFKSFRVGEPVASVCRTLGFSLEGTGISSISFLKLSEGAVPLGLIICDEFDTTEYLSRHNLAVAHPESVRGITVDHCTLVSKFNALSCLNRNYVYIALTRASQSVTVILGDACLSDLHQTIAKPSVWEQLAAAVQSLLGF